MPKSAMLHAPDSQEVTSISLVGCSCENHSAQTYVHLGEVPVLPELLSVQQAPLASQGFLQMPWRAGPVDLPLVQVMPGTCLDESVVAPQHL